MGISPQLTQDFNSTKNDKDLIETQNVQDFNSNKKPSKIPDYAKDYKNEYLFIIAELHPRAKRARGRSPIAKEMW